MIEFENEKNRKRFDFLIFRIFSFFSIFIFSKKSNDELFEKFVLKIFRLKFCEKLNLMNFRLNSNNEKFDIIRKNSTTTITISLIVNKMSLKKIECRKK